MKYILTGLITWVLLSAFIFAGFAFANWELDPLHWADGDRGTYAFSAILTLIGVVVITIKEHDDADTAHEDAPDDTVSE